MNLPLPRRRHHMQTRFFFVLIAALLCPAMIIGQIERMVPAGTAIGQDSQAPQASATYSVSGTVVNAITGAPVPHALVQIMAQAQRETSPGAVMSYQVPHATFTDESGQFTIDGLGKPNSSGYVFRGALTSIQVFKPGYFSTDETPGPKPFVRIGDDKAQPINVSLMPDSVITGHVLDDNGEAVTPAMVTARCARVIDGRKQWQDCANVPVDEDGAFRMTHLMPGSYYLRARAFGSMRQQDGGPGGHKGHLPAYYPVERDGTSHGTLELRPGARFDATLKMREGGVFNMYGVVSGVPSAANAAITLTTSTGEAIPTDMQLEPQSGTFVIKNVPPGAYRIRASTNDGTGNMLTAEAPVTVGNDVVNVDLTLRPAITIPVVVHTEFTRDRTETTMGGPIALNGVTTNVTPPPVYGCLRGIDHPEVTTCITNDIKDGVQSVELRNVSPGRYSVEMQPQGMAYVAAASYEGNDVLTEPLMVSRDAPPGALEVTLRDDSGMLSLSLNESSDRSPTVLIVPEKGRVISIMIGGRGESGLPNIPPGEYKIYAFDRAEGLEYRNPDALAEYATRAASVTLGPNEKRSVKLDVIHRSEP